MAQHSYACLVLATTLLAVNSVAAAQKKHDCKKENTGTCVYDLSSGTVTGETQRGPGKVKATKLNTIRYDYEFNSAVTYQASPDIWSGLSSLATTNSAAIPTPPNPAPPATNVQKTAEQAPVQVPGIAPGDAFAPVNQALQSAADQITSANLVNTQLQTQWQPLTELNGLTANLLTYQIAANATTATVANAGSSLVNYLNFTTNSSEDLVRATKDQLADEGTLAFDGTSYATTSPFIAGSKANWPDITGIVTLQSSLVQNAATLGTLNAALANDLLTIKASEAAINDATSQLNAAYSTFTAHNSPTTPESTIVQSRINSLNATLAILQADEKALGLAPTLVSTAINQNTADVAAVTALLPSSPAYTSFLNARAALLQWKAKMTTTLENWKNSKANPRTAADPFSKESDYENCGFAFSGTKDDVVTLTRVDLAPGATNASPPPVVLTVKIECTSPFNLSAGVAFSTIPDHEYTISQVQTTSGGTTTTSDIITQNSMSSFHPLPLALASMRFWEPDEKFSMAFSFGVAANIRDQTSGGSTAEYLIGPSFELFRTLIITTGVHLGSEAGVGGGYSVNSTVPSSVTTVPINTNYTAGFGLGISFTKP
jgi:hypothetical protein